MNSEDHAKAIELTTRLRQSLCELWRNKEWLSARTDDAFRRHDIFFHDAIDGLGDLDDILYNQPVREIVAVETAAGEGVEAASAKPNAPSGGTRGDDPLSSTVAAEALWLHAVNVSDEIDRMLRAHDDVLDELSVVDAMSDKVKAAEAAMEGAVVIARRELNGITDAIGRESCHKDARSETKAARRPAEVCPTAGRTVDASRVTRAGAVSQ